MLKRFLINIFTLFIFLILSSNISEASNTTTINNVPQKSIYNYILETSLKAGYTIKSSNEYSLVFEKNGPWPTKFYLNWGTNAKILYVWNLVQTGSDTLLSNEIRIVQNPNSSSEREHVASYENASGYFPGYKDDLKNLADLSISDLKGFKVYFNGRYYYGFEIANKKKDYVEIKGLSNNSPAEKAGLLVGDKITKINDKLVKTLSNDDINKLFQYGEEGSIITLIVKRGNEEKAFIISKQFSPPTYKAP